MSSPSALSTPYYQLRPLTRHFGVEVIGVDLSQIDLTNNNDNAGGNSISFIQQLKSDLIAHRALLFRGQSSSLVSGQRQVDISNALGGHVESTFYKHPKSPHPDIFRVSNNELEGCTQVGRSGWHIDGTFQYRPFMYQTMYFPSVAKGGDTYFVPLKELYESVSNETRERWDKLWMKTSRGRRQSPVHPLVYQHPFRNDPTMVFHCGSHFVEGWYEEKEGQQQQQHHVQETFFYSNSCCSESESTVDLLHMIPSHVIQDELTQEIEMRLHDIGFKMQWEKGDFMITDNLGLAHYATEGTQCDWRRVGLRILHRTTVVGGPETVPRKQDGRCTFTF